VDPHHIDADPDADPDLDPDSTDHLNARPDADSDPNLDPDSTELPDADPEFDFYLMRMRIPIRLFTLMRIRIQILASK
jgi:hypothetical protein